jgi:hypothetical protein
MKKIFTLVAVLFSITTFSFAAERPAPGKIFISKNDKAFMQVKIDGKMYNLGNTFVLDDIRPGKHNITIYKSESAGFRKRTEVIYNSSLFIDKSQLVNIDINRFGKVSMSQSSQRFNHNDHYRGNDRPFDNNGRNDKDDHYRH